jgi:hypothetical protein
LTISASLILRDIAMPSEKVAMESNADPPMDNVDKFIAAIVIIGIAIFAAFQINQCIESYANPVSQSSTQVFPRKFPAMLLCPFATDLLSYPDSCPKWAPDAYLEASASGANLINTNIFDDGRRGSVCENNIGTLVNNPTYPNALILQSLRRQVTVKNVAKPRFKIANSQNIECKSWTPPNVKCIVFNPQDAKRDIETMTRGKNPVCNPMEESKANSLDSLRLFFGTTIFHWGLQYRYQGLIPQPNAPQTLFPSFIEVPFRRTPSELSVTALDLQAQGATPQQTGIDGVFNVNMSLFSGIVAVFYDSENEPIPTELDFDGVRSSTMSDSILASTVVIETNCYTNRGSLKTCYQNQMAPQDAFVSAKRTQDFESAIYNKRVNKTTLKMVIQRSLFDQKTLDPQSQGLYATRYDLSVSFATSESVFEKQFVTLTILTTVSIIVSTAASLWGARAKIKEGIVTARSKIKCLQAKSNVNSVEMKSREEASEVIRGQHLADIAAFDGDEAESVAASTSNLFNRRPNSPVDVRYSEKAALEAKSSFQHPSVSKLDTTPGRYAVESLALPRSKSSFNPASSDLAQIHSSITPSRDDPVASSLRSWSTGGESFRQNLSSFDGVTGVSDFKQINPRSPGLAPSTRQRLAELATAGFASDDVQCDPLSSATIGNSASWRLSSSRSLRQA